LAPAEAPEDLLSGAERTLVMNGACLQRRRLGAIRLPGLRMVRVVVALNERSVEPVRDGAAQGCLPCADRS